HHIFLQPRYLLTSLSLGELLKGLIAAPLSVYPSLYHCWPYPRPVCGLQALLLPLLHQHTATTLSLLAMDQYWCILHPGAYRDSVGTVKSVLLVLLSWVVNLVWFIALFLPTPHFYFSYNHSYACEPHQSVHPKVIITACVLYFPTTMV
ncbi:G protein-coupled receptor rhodopsin-like, partial [Trinorchestia longiramus]